MSTERPEAVSTRPDSLPEADGARAGMAPGKSLEPPAAWMIALLLTGGLLAYSNTFSAPFIFDDVDAITGNLQIRHLWPIQAALQPPDQSPVAGRPVVNLSLAINYALDGLNVRGYHAFNLACHLLSALLLMAILRHALRSPLLQGRFERAADPLATLAAAIWMLHPLQTEAVTYLTQRTELMAGLCYLLTLYSAVRAWQSPHPYRWYAAAVAACLLGIGSKEIVVSAPLFVLLYDRALISGAFGRTLKRHAPLYIGLAATWILLVVLMSSGPRSQSAGFGLGISARSYLYTQAGVLTHYLRLALWPHPLVLSYDDWPRAASLLEVWPQCVLVVALLGATAWGLWRNRVAALLGAWFFLILAPTSSFVPIVTEFAAERRMYLPLAAVVLLVVLGGYAAMWRIAATQARWRVRVTCAAAGLSILLGSLLGAVTLARNHQYRRALSIWTDTVRKRPGNALARLELGNALASAGLHEEALLQYGEAIHRRPRFAEAHADMANALVALRRFDEAMDRYRRALELEPRAFQVYTNLGAALEAQGRSREAIVQFERALQINPQFAEAHVNLGNALAGRGDLDEAARHLREAAWLQPHAWQMHLNLGVVLAEKGDLEAARQSLEQALQLNPLSPQVHNNLGLVRLRAGERDSAVEHFREALRLDPGYELARANLMECLAGPTDRPH